MTEIKFKGLLLSLKSKISHFFSLRLIKSDALRFLQMDSNTVVTPDHRAEIDRLGNILLWPVSWDGNLPKEMRNDQKIVTQLVEAALGSARAEMDGLIVRSALSPAMYVGCLLVSLILLTLSP